MKKTIKSFIAIAAAIAALVSCAKEVSAPVDENEGMLIKLTLVASNPEAQPATRTEMVGSTPYWSVGDAIGVSNGTNTNYKFTTEITSRATSASFTGTTAVSSTLYAYYPYTGNGVGLIDNKYYGAKVDLPSNQSPSANSFDGKADVMVAKQFTVDPENTTVEELEFARLGAVVKIVLIDQDNTMTGTQHPTTVSITAESDLAGRVLIDMQNQVLLAPYYNQSSTVTANYTTETKYALDGTNATYLVVYPQTLAEGSTLTILASTEDYTLSKEITIPSGGLELQPGKLTTLKIKFAASNISSESGATLPFTDDFSWQEASSGALTSVDPKYSSFERAYADRGAGTVRIGTNDLTGYLTTKELDLSSAFYVKVSAYAYNSSDGSKIRVVVDGETDQTASEVMTSTTASTDYFFNFSAATKKSKVTITTDKSRAVLTGIQIVSGAHVFPPVINITSDNPMNVENTASSQIIEYTIENPTTATLTASTTAAWITNIDCSTSGQVSFDVAAQEDGAAVRSGVITLSYPNAPDVEVTVNQDAGEGGKTEQMLFHESFGNNSGSARAWDDSYSVKSGVSAVYSGITSYTVTNAKQSKNTVGSTESGLVQTTKGTDAVLIIGPLNVATAEDMVLSYQWKAASVKETYSTSLYYATSSNGTYTEVTGTGNGATSFVERSYSLPAAAQVSTLFLKIVWNTSNTQAIIDEVNLSGLY